MRRWLGVLAAAVLAFTVGTSKTSTSGQAGPNAAKEVFAPSDVPSATADDSSEMDLRGCARPLPVNSLPALRRLPWPVVLTTACGRFAAFPTGLLTRAPAVPGEVADPGYRVPAGPDAWASVQSGQVVFVRTGRTVWRSAGRQYDPQSLGSAVVGRGWVAFSMYARDDPSPLYLAIGARPERIVAHNEDPLVATDGGFLASRWRSDGRNPDLVAHGPGGSPGGVIARRVVSVFPEPGGTVLYQKARKLWRTDGTGSVLLADLSALGSRRFVGAQPLPDGRIFVSGLDRIAVLRPDGQFASSATLGAIPKGGWGFIELHTVDPWRKALVVTATRWDDEMMGGGPGWEGVYLLGPGARTARLLFGRKLNIAVCAHSATFAWRGRWLLYSACEGRVVAIDTTGRLAPVFLSRLVRAVPEPKDELRYGLYGAEWASFGPASTTRTAITLR